jgi:hypothetical protein
MEKKESSEPILAKEIEPVYNKTNKSSLLSRESPVAARFVRESPSFRNNPEHRRESPRNAEPVRKYTSREPNKNVPVVNSPSKEFSSKLSEFYKNSPTTRPIPRPKTIENQEKDSSRLDEASRESPNTSDNLSKPYEEAKKSNPNFAKPPRKSKP